MITSNAIFEGQMKQDAIVEESVFKVRDPNNYPIIKLLNDSRLTASL